MNDGEYGIGRNDARDSGAGRSMPSLWLTVDDPKPGLPEEFSGKAVTPAKDGDRVGLLLTATTVTTRVGAVMIGASSWELTAFLIWLAATRQTAQVRTSFDGASRNIVVGTLTPDDARSMLRPAIMTFGDSGRYSDELFNLHPNVVMLQNPAALAVFMALQSALLREMVAEELRVNGDGGGHLTQRQHLLLSAFGVGPSAREVVGCFASRRALLQMAAAVQAAQ